MQRSICSGKKNSNTRIEKIIDEKDGSTIFYDEIENWHLKYLNITQAQNAIATIAIIKELKLEPKKFIILLVI